MVGSIYFALGVIMVLVAKTAENHKALVDFLIIGNFLHCIIMIVYAQTAVHVLIDAGFIGLMGLIPLVLYPWGLKKFLRY
jgi:cadmium resistance protein CadD (predicted permease)